MKSLNLTVFTYSYQQDVNTPAVPIGVLAFGAYQEQAFYAFAGLDGAGTRYGKEQIEILLMNDLPGWFKMVKHGVDDLVQQLKEAEIQSQVQDILHQVVAWNHGKTFHVSQVEDVEIQFVTDPGSGVIPYLSDKLESICHNSGDKYIYGFMAENSLPESKLLN